MDEIDYQGPDFRTGLVSEALFFERWHRERDFYRAWAAFVREEIEGGLLRMHPGLNLEVFVKIAAIPRLKTDDSLLGKAFHRSKGYADPYADIEDKVGLRFVVLLTEDIRKLQAVVEASASWTWSLDRDFEAERDAKPLEFVYQSKHFVVKATRDTTLGGILVPAGTPCEVQLRTLLQHAHSELTHDNIYKREPGSNVTKRVERTVAKSMALIEAVDDYFVVALKELESATEVERAALATLTDAYIKYVGPLASGDKSSAIVLHAFKASITANLSDRLDNFLKKYDFVPRNVRARAQDQYIFRQPWVLLAYLLVQEAPRSTAAQWPLTPEEIRPLYIDLAKPWPDR